MIRQGWDWRIIWEPRDMWIGVYWTQRVWQISEGWEVYVCVLPMLPLRVRWWRPIPAEELR
jgi:hypothetical protein